MVLLPRIYVAVDFGNLLKLLIVKSLFDPHPAVCTHKHTYLAALIKSTITLAFLSQLPSHQIHPPRSPYDCKVYGLLISRGLLVFFPDTL